MDFDPELYNKLTAMANRRTAKMPWPDGRLFCRTCGTAQSVISLVYKIPFEKLSLSIYMYGQENYCKEFTRAYESQMELANIDPLKFQEGLHKFFKEMERKIKKEKLYLQFFDFLQAAIRIGQMPMPENNPYYKPVSTAYGELLMQQLCYLKQDKYDFTQTIVGMATDGTLLLRPDLSPDIDLIGYEFSSLPKHQQTLSAIARIGRKYGYELLDPSLMESITWIDNNFSTMIAGMIPYINEYTIDILPERVHTCEVEMNIEYQHAIDTDHLKEKLSLRRRTLPPAGYWVDVDHPYFHSVFYREGLYNDHIVMLYRLSTEDGDLSGFYDTRTRFYFSTIVGEQAVMKNFREFVEALVLLGYADRVLDDQEYNLVRLGDFLKSDGIPMAAVGFTLGDSSGAGKGTGTPTGPSVNSEKYEHYARDVMGYVRALPLGQKPSDEARAYARRLGLELAENETYVRPFKRRVLRLRPVAEEKE